MVLLEIGCFSVEMLVCFGNSLLANLENTNLNIKVRMSPYGGP